MHNNIADTLVAADQNEKIMETTTNGNVLAAVSSSSSSAATTTTAAAAAAAAEATTALDSKPHGTTTPPTTHSSVSTNNNDNSNPVTEASSAATIPEKEHPHQSNNNNSNNNDYLSYIMNRGSVGATTTMGKRKHDTICSTSSNQKTTADPETDAGLELLFAASLIQQKDDSAASNANGHHHDRSYPAAKAISSCSGDESLTAEVEVSSLSPPVPPPKAVVVHEDEEEEEVPGDETTIASSSKGGGLVLVEPNDLDVLAGRGGRVNSHVGNVVYRKVVDYNKTIYRQVPKRHRILVSQSIVQTIQKHGGRFLQATTGTANGKEGGGGWTCIPYRRAVQKTSQALREPSTESGDGSVSGAAVASDSLATDIYKPTAI